MKLSIIIVNYNVEHFLEQCLNSVFAAAKNLELEVIVVDNDSVDGSLKMLLEKFLNVKVIANKENVGFSKANNQGIKISKGEYVLLLNPDTIVEEDTLLKTINFMDSHQDAGGLGVKMIDGKGRFLPESKRGLPTPAAAFYKMFGFSKIFPKSKRFASYHQGHLDNDKTHEIEILSGAFMLMRMSALNKIGLLDEDFFMYGEDIDLSYRLLQGGYKNYYFPETRIIHYKGESTKKNTINYVYVFYNAMIIFAKKHYSKENAKLFSFFINTAIIIRAIITLVTSTLRALILPVLDFILIYSTIILISKYWAIYIFQENKHYPDLFLYVFIPLIILFWQIIIYYSGGYDKPIKAQKIIIGQIIGSFLILIIYALLPESYRFSRALIFIGSFISGSTMLLWRFIGFNLGFKSLKFGSKSAKRIAIIGDNTEVERVMKLIKKTSINASFSAKILIDTNIHFNDNENILGNINQLDEIVKIHKITELIFCAKNFQVAEIIEMMSAFKSNKMDFKIAPSEQMFIIGSNSINTSSDDYFIEMKSINEASNKRFKRLFDFFTGIALLASFLPILFLFKRPLNYFKNIFMLIIGFYTVVGFDKKLDNLNLPILKKSILFPSDILDNKEDNSKIVEINITYARNYKILNDLSILLKAFNKMDRS